MQKGLLRSSLTFIIGCSLLSVQSCKKENNLGIDNDKVIKTPYNLYVANENGWLLNSNDGLVYSSVFAADGYAPGAIVTSAGNLLFIKNNLHLSENNGKNFNPVFFTVNHQPWQEMIIDAPMQSRMYVTSTVNRGVAYSEDHGKTWIEDTMWATTIPVAVRVNSFAATNDGAVYSFSNQNLMLLRKANPGARWEGVVAEGEFPTDRGDYFLTTNGNTLYLTDHSGRFDEWMSEDGGKRWTRLYRRNIPFAKKIYSAAQATGGSLLIGVDSGGVYRLSGRDYVTANGGLEKNTSVYRIVVKKNIYKNNVINEYVFIATSTGIYRSEDKGLNWDKMTFEQYDGVFRAMY